MKFLKSLSVAILAFSLVGISQAKDEHYFTVPFHHVEIKEASKIYVNYHFDAHRQTLVCSEDSPNHAINSIEWEYKGATRKIDLPVVLKDDKRFDGYWADTKGNLVITNEFGAMIPDTSIYVSCEYRKMD